MSLLNELSIPLTVRKSSRAKNIIFKIIPEKGLEIVIPLWVNQDEISGYVENRRGWIERTIEKMRQKGLALEPKPLILPESIIFAANHARYEVVRSRTGRGKLKIHKNVDRLLLRGEAWSAAEEVEALRKFVRIEARAFLVPELRKISRELNLPFERVAVRCQRRRWGSCSAKHNINLNCKLMFLPFELVRHLFIHELCHTIHLNHSPNYWKLVSVAQPDYKDFERRLSQGSKYIPEWMNF